MKSRGVYVYKYEIDWKTGKYVLTGKTNQISLYWIERILGVVPVKNSKVPYELIEIKNRHYNVDGFYLVKRKNITFDVISSFVSTCSYCTRSEQLRPYTKDLKDPDLLSDLGIRIFTFKHWAGGDKVLYDQYIAIREKDVDQEFLHKIKSLSEAAIAEYKYSIGFDKQEIKIKWEDV